MVGTDLSATRDGVALALHHQGDLDEYRALARASDAARDEYLSGRHGLEASRDFTPGSVHMEYHRTLAAKWAAGAAFFGRWGFWPEDDE